MSEPVLKQRPTVDLDDFERRLRQATAAPAHRDDPLAELARLVGEPYDPYGDVFAHDTARQAERDNAHAEHAAPAARAPGYAPDVPRLFGDFSAIEAGLRSEDHQSRHGGYGAAQQEAGYVAGGQLPFDGEGEWAGAAPGEGYASHTDGHHTDGHQDDHRRDDGRYDPRGERSGMRRPMALMAASIAIGVIGIGAAFALKGRVASSPREVKTIMADATPTKIQPPPEADTTADAGFGRGNAGNGTQPSRLVSREEQPIDVGQAVQDNVARAARVGTATDAASVPVPPGPGQARGTADPIAAQVQGFGLAEMPAPKRVKVVAVRPDGSIVPGDETSRRPSTATRDADRDAAKAATPKAAPGKTTSRVGAKANEKGSEKATERSGGDKTIEQAAAEDDTAKPARKVKPQRVAAAETEDAATEPAADGGFAVQLAAPTSESDAKAASSRLSKKFSEALGGRRIAIRKAESNGKSVYRVRVSSLSRADANSLCDKLKADGGSCFVAKN